MSKQPKLLDTTLRDGSYVIDFQFTLEQVAAITCALDQSGVDFIEVCNGNGIGAGEAFPQFKGLYTDLEYVEMARKNIRGKSKIGVIAAPFFSSDPLMQPLWEFIDFVRLAVNMKDPKGIHEFIANIKAHGKMAFVQLVRSSMVKHQDLIELAKQFEAAGADVIYCVDTGGLWTPEETFETVTLLKKNLHVPIGFHGHNHLQLAVANTLAALKAGAEYVDGCLHTMGKGAGNAQTEILAHLLREQVQTPYDVDALIEVAHEIVAPLLKDTRAGTSDFALRCAVKGMDFSIEVMREIQKHTHASQEEVLAAFKAIPDFFDVTPENITFVVQQLLAQRKVTRVA